MHRLIDDISGFLAGQGFQSAVRTYCGMEMLYVVHGGDMARVGKMILPVEIYATSPEEAGQQSSAIAEALEKMKAEGIRLPVIITEDRWHRQRKAMEGRLMAHLETFSQIYARNCEIRRIDKATASGFLEDCHSYGDASCRYRYGMFLKRHTGHNLGSSEVTPGTLTAVAEFSNARKWKKGGKVIRSYEWTRYASLPGIRVVGGMGKMLDTFIREVGPDDIMSYADLEWSEGAAYGLLGFTSECRKEPVLFEITGDWERVPVRPEREENGTEAGQESPRRMYFRNLGSGKYRLKLTSYE